MEVEEELFGESDQDVIDISWKYGVGLAKDLSNLAPRPFVLEYGSGAPLECASIEAALQSLKFQDVGMQRAVAAIPSGPVAWRTGQKGNDWKVEQFLWFNGFRYWRQGIEYQNLLDKLYMEAYRQNESFRDQLAQTVGKTLAHTRGEQSNRNTVLTPIEYISRLERLRSGMLA